MRTSGESGGKRDAIRTARRRNRRACAWEWCSCGSGSGRRGALGSWAWSGSPSARMGGDVRTGGRAARFPVGRRQGRGLGQACAGVRGEFARTAGVGRGELGANVGMAHFWRSWMVAKRADQKRALSSRCPGPSEFLHSVPDRRPSVTVYQKEVNSGCCCERLCYLRVVCINMNVRVCFHERTAMRDGTHRSLWRGLPFRAASTSAELGANKPLSLGRGWRSTSRPPRHLAAWTTS